MSIILTDIVRARVIGWPTYNKYIGGTSQKVNLFSAEPVSVQVASMMRWSAALRRAVVTAAERASGSAPSTAVPQVAASLFLMESPRPE